MVAVLLDQYVFAEGLHHKPEDNPSICTIGVIVSGCM